MKTFPFLLFISLQQSKNYLPQPFVSPFAVVKRKMSKKLDVIMSVNSES